MKGLKFSLAPVSEVHCFHQYRMKQILLFHVSAALRNGLELQATTLWAEEDDM